MVNDESIEQMNSFILINFESADELEGTFNHLHCYASSAEETRLVSICPQPNIDNKHISIAPGQGKQPNYILNYRYYEEISFAHLFPTGKFGYQVQRDTPLSPLKYFNKRLLITVRSLLKILAIHFLHGVFFKV